MTAKSYLGTMCIGVATTGVEGLKTIIPEAAISNWYAYYRTGGLNLPAIGWQGDDVNILAKYCFSRAKDPEDYESIKEAYAKAQDEMIQAQDRATGNYNRFWDERNYLNLVDKIKASVFIVHGINAVSYTHLDVYKRQVYALRKCHCISKIYLRILHLKDSESTFIFA